MNTCRVRGGGWTRVTRFRCEAHAVQLVSDLVRRYLGGAERSWPIIFIRTPCNALHRPRRTLTDQATLDARYEFEGGSRWPDQVDWCGQGKARTHVSGRSPPATRPATAGGEASSGVRRFGVVHGPRSRRASMVKKVNQFGGGVRRPRSDWLKLEDGSALPFARRAGGIAHVD